MRLLSRHGATTAPIENQKPKNGRRDRRWFWVTVVAVIAVVMGGYFWLTSARLLSEPIRIDYGPLDASFANAMGPMTGADFTDGNAITTLVNGDAFFPSMLEAIRGAKATITMENYIWSTGYISNQFIAALT